MRIVRRRSRRTRRGLGETHAKIHPIGKRERKAVFEDCEREKQENPVRIR